MPGLLGRKGQRVRQVRRVILGVRRDRRESRAMKGRSDRKECRAFKARLEMMARQVPKVRKASKASQVKPGHKESQEIPAARQGPRVQLDRMARPRRPAVKARRGRLER